jgi:hypothetical protein
MTTDWNLKTTLHTANVHLKIDQPSSTNTAQQKHVMATEE